MTPEGLTEVRGTPLRRDAARNRERILGVAAAVFAEQGLEAGYDEIARRAGVGVGTVYRRFPDRTELVRALFESRVAEVVELAREAASRPDAWAALVFFLESALERQVADRGLAQVMSKDPVDDDAIARHRADLEPLLTRVVERAIEQGALRADVSASDLGLHLLTMSTLTTEEHPDLWRRYLALFLDGLRAPAMTAPLPLQAPSDDVVHEIVTRLHGR